MNNEQNPLLFNKQGISVYKKSLDIINARDENAWLTNDEIMLCLSKFKFED